jgi:NAD(P)-dependent dehydrogenase (short-subunit alcohol dehydrogenase family)
MNSRPIAIVTGGAGNLGRSVTRGLIDDGYAVLVLDRATVPAGQWVASIPVDITVADAVADAVADGSARWGPPAALVTCHGWSPKAADGQADGAAAMPPADFMDVIRANLLGCYIALQAIVPAMATAGGGRVVNVASTSGLTGRTTASAAYAAAKAGIESLTRSFAAEYGARGVLVTAVAPGKFASPGWADAPVTLEQYTASIPLGRLATAGDVAAVIQFLASARNTYITGHTIVIDGGRLA